MTGQLHKNLALRCGPWLKQRITGRGMRSGFEVPVREKYIVDWLALCGFQDRFRGLYVEEKRLDTRNGIRVSPEFACVFEAKGSKSDFLSTFGPSAHVDGSRKFPVGSLHWIVAPRGLLCIHEVPDFWGLLVPSGAGLHEVKRPRYCRLTDDDLYKLGYHLLWYGKEWPG